jgi:transcriptional regulator with XRE-family HTH domain
VFFLSLAKYYYPVYTFLKEGIIMTIGERITQLRTRRKMSQSALANASGVPLSVINMLEAGIRSGENLRVETARKLANALTVTMDYLCGVHEEEDSELLPAGVA